MKRYSNFHGSMNENPNGPWVDISDVFKLQDKYDFALEMVADYAAEIERLLQENKLLKLNGGKC